MQCAIWAIWKADDAMHLPRLLLSLSRFIFTGSTLSFSHPATFLALPFWFSFHRLLFFRRPTVLCRTGNLVKFQEQHFFFFFFFTREGQQVQWVSKDLCEPNCGTNLRTWLSGLNGKQNPRESRLPIVPLDNGHIFFYFSLQSQEIHF